MIRIIFCACWICFVCQTRAASPSLKWRQLPPIPDQIGFAGSFVGVSGGALLFAGGANFPRAMPWQGGQKVWYDSMYVLPEPDGQWLPGFKLPHPLGYGVSVSANDSMICAGGADARQHYRDVFRLTWRHETIQMESLAPLPRPMANACGALVEHTLYLAGGVETPGATNCLKTFWALDLKTSIPHWRELTPWPGPSRMLAVAGVYKGSFFLFSGAELSGDSQGKPVRHYLKDTYEYRPSSGWRRLADLPRPSVAAPSPAISFHEKLLIVSGDDGAHIDFEPKSAHPGFPQELLAFDPKANQWSIWSNAPISRATAPVTVWNRLAVIPNGEVRPGVRTPQVWGLDLR